MRDNYDAFKYNFKTRASLESFNKRSDRYFFERLSRKKNTQEIKEFFLSNFVAATTPQSVYVPNLVQEGEETYINWKRRVESLSYMFKTEVEVFVPKEDFNKFFICENNQHSPMIRKYLQKGLSIETLVIFNEIFDYIKSYDKILDDPIWEMVRLKVKKYSPFLNINRDKYSKILKEIVCE
jgi:hypothetical protein